MHQAQVLAPMLGAPQKTSLHNCHPNAEGLGGDLAFSQSLRAPKSTGPLSLTIGILMQEGRGLALPQLDVPCSWETLPHLSGDGGGMDGGVGEKWGRDQEERMGKHVIGM